MVKKIQSEVGDDQLWTSIASPIACLIENKVIFLLKIMLMLMLIYDKPLLSGQPPYKRLAGASLSPTSCSFFPATLAIKQPLASTKKVAA